MIGIIMPHDYSLIFFYAFGGGNVGGGCVGLAGVSGGCVVSDF